MTSPSIVETVARAIENADIWFDDDSCATMAAKLLQSLTASGFVVVPREPTERMQWAAAEELERQYHAHPKWDDAKNAIEEIDCAALHRAMLSAASQEQK